MDPVASATYIAEHNMTGGPASKVHKLTEGFAVAGSKFAVRKTGMKESQSQDERMATFECAIQRSKYPLCWRNQKLNSR
jgi:hypothetical protein